MQIVNENTKKVYRVREIHLFISLMFNICIIQHSIIIQLQSFIFVCVLDRYFTFDYCITPKLHRSTNDKT